MGEKEARQLQAEATVRIYAILNKFPESIEHLQETGQPRDHDERQIVRAVMCLVAGNKAMDHG